ncbi:MAG: hypothetical protein ACI4J6_06545 [Oscillospiraceae bacterium]
MIQHKLVEIIMEHCKLHEATAYTVNDLDIMNRVEAAYKEFAEENKNNGVDIK